MATHVSGQAAAVTTAPTLHVGTYRRALLAVIIGNDLFSEAEQLRANHNAHECQDAAKLALWTRNSQRVAAERQAQQQAQGLANLAEGLARFEAKQAAQPTAQPAPTPAPTPWATPAQCDEVYRLACLPCFTQGEKQHALRGLVTLTRAGAVKVIGSLYAAAWRRGQLPLHPENGPATSSPGRLTA